MRAGRLRHKITLQVLTNTKNDFNETVKEFVDFKTVPASVETLSSREAFFSSKVVEESNAKFRIRYLTGINTDTRIIYKDRKFDIQEIANPYERNVELVIAAKEIF